MENAAVANVLRGEGYRYCQTNLAEAGIYYKYYQEGFHIVMAVDLSGGNRFSVQQYRSMEEHAMDLFYHPQGRLGDFPDGFPVYHVEMLTLLIGGDSEVERKLCAECRNVWVYQPQSGRLLIYENQPGDFFGLRRALEQGVGGGGTGETSWHGTGTGGRTIAKRTERPHRHWHQKCQRPPAHLLWPRLRAFHRQRPRCGHDCHHPHAAGTGRQGGRL